MNHCLFVVLSALMIRGTWSQTTGSIPITGGKLYFKSDKCVTLLCLYIVLPNSYWLYQSNEYESNLPCLQDAMCSVVARFNDDDADDEKRSSSDNLVLLNCSQPSALFDGNIGREIEGRGNLEVQDLLAHYTWQAGIVPYPFVAMTFNPPLEELTGITLYLYREGRHDARAPYISICVSSSTSFTPCTEVLMRTRPNDLNNGVLIYDFTLQSPTTPILFLNITFEHENGPDSDEWIFLSEVRVSGTQQQPPPPGM